MKVFYGLLIALIVMNLLLFPSGAAAEPAIPENATVTSATLSVYVSLVNGYSLNVHRVTANWSETGGNWGNFASSYDPEVIANFRPTSAGWQTIDVKDVVQSWINGTNPNYGLLFAQEETAPSGSLYAGLVSSEESTIALRPELEICYDLPGAGNTCVTIQRSGSSQGDVADTYIYSTESGTNFGTANPLYIGREAGWQKQALLRFAFTVVPAPEPAVSIIKFTNGVEASDPDGTDVPRISPGQPVTWTYQITNTGEVAVPRTSVSVTDDHTGVTPAFVSVLSGNDDDIFDPGEVWLYQANGVAVNLALPPSGVPTVADRCTLNGVEAPRNAYVNQGAVAIPGASATALSSYCNPPEVIDFWYHYYLPLVNNDAVPSEPEITPFKVTVGYEDLPLLLGQNDYDYNDWVVRIQGSVTPDATNRDLWRRIRMDFDPGGRGATYTHSFHINFPANTFSSNGTATLVIYGANGSPLSTQTIPFVAASNNDITIFTNSGEVFPANFSNTIETSPRVVAQRTASLTIEFNQPISFNLNNYNFTIPHGTGLFFDPYIRVINTGDVVRRGDNRLLNVSEADRDYLWPEERVRIDRAYPLITFQNGIPPVITFPNRWWTNSNNCVIDGATCQ